MSSTRFNPPVPEFEVRTGVGDTTVPDGDGVIEPGENDYSNRNRSTLRKYISSLTRGVEPTEGIAPDSGPISVPHANPFPLNPAGRDDQFTDQAGLRDAAYREGIPGTPFDGALVENIVRVGQLGEASDSIELSGHELLPGVVGSESRDGVVRTRTEGSKNYVTSLGQALSEKNLYSGKLSVEGGETFEDRTFTLPPEQAPGDGSAATTRRVLLGDTFVDSITSKSYDAKAASRTEAEDLHGVALRLMRKAVGADEDGNGGVEAKLGKKKVDTNQLRAASISSFKQLNRTTLAEGNDELDAGEDGAGEGTYTRTSWPNLHSPDEPYTGFESTSDAFTAFVTSQEFIAAVLTTAGLGLLIPAIAKGLIPAEINIGNSGSRRQLRMGRFRNVPQSSVLAGLSDGLEIASNITGLTISQPIHVVTNPLTDYPGCVIAGLASFLGVTYGIDPGLIGFGFLNGNTPIITAQIAVRILAIFADPAARQYYMNVIREINRDTLALNNGLSNVSFGAELDFSDVGAALGAVNSIFDSKLFKFVNTLAQVGDLAYTQAAAIDYRKTDLESEPDMVYSTFDPSSDSSGIAGSQKLLMQGFGARRIYGDRIKGRRGVSYSLSDLPSYHLIPSGSTQSYHSLLGSSAVASRMKSVSAKGSSDGRLRFSPEQVSEMESVLDAEYMPFYFQDLRTNEIIAFHAFLEDLNDSYTANYNNAGGYGRIEEIKTYKDTKRSVGCTFQIVATNPQDFDYMWWQINKLTTMVYPQWSKGRDLASKVNNVDFKFTQPFSQIPTATPIIRLRVGDLIRSNYSRFNLKRIFGYQDTEKKQSRSKIGAGATTYTIKPGTYSNVDDTAVYLFEKTFTAIKDPVKSKEYYDNVFMIVSSPDNPAAIGSSIVVDSTNYTEFNAESFDSNGNVTLFYDPAENSVIRSFETTAGMGLAAVVTQLQFTWMDGLWGAGDDGPGRRAPRSCKVQMSFDPIHDIAPGLDHEGFNRAPTYPVGSLINGIVEGGEPEPYGVGTTTRALQGVETAVSKASYEEAFKQGPLQKLF
jgi:hypothetical protein